MNRQDAENAKKTIGQKSPCVTEHRKSGSDYCFRLRILEVLASLVPWRFKNQSILDPIYHPLSYQASLLLYTQTRHNLQLCFPAPSL